MGIELRRRLSGRLLRSRPASGLLLVGAVALLAACRDRVEGSGQAVTEQRDVPPFTELRIRGAVATEVRIGDPQSVAITGDDNVVRVIKTEVRDGRLSIEPEKSYDSDVPLRVAIVVPELEEIEASGAATVTVSGLDADELSIKASGASMVRASGSAERIDAEASGASRIGLEELTAEEAEADASGASTIEVTVSGQLSGSASGASTVTYAGNPQVDVSRSGASNVRSR